MVAGSEDTMHHPEDEPEEQEPRLFIGCAGFVGPRERYWQQLSLVELTETFHGFPKAKALRQVRQQAGPDKAIVVTASQVVTHPPEDPAFRVERTGRPAGPCGLLRDTEAVWDAWASTVQGAEAVDAQGVLLRTPPLFTPTAAHRRALALFVERVRGELGERLLAWEPTGLWEPDDAAALAAELGLVRAVNPLRDPPTSGPTAYFRLRGLTGVRRGYTEDDLEEVLDKAAPFAEAFIVFDHQDRLIDARRLARLAGAEGAGDTGDDAL